MFTRRSSAYKARYLLTIVPVLKNDKSSVRICGDSESTVNRVARFDSYPIPKIEELLSSLAGGQTYAKLDLSQAYQRLPLPVWMKFEKYAIINTLFQYSPLASPRHLAYSSR